MGNIISPCFIQEDQDSSIKLIFWEGSVKILRDRKRHIAGEIMFEFPDKMVCNSDSFFIGQPIPSLAIEDELHRGQTYFVLPLDLFSSNVLSSSSLAALGSQNPKTKRVPLDFGDCPFEYMKSENGRLMIKVIPEFITNIILKGIDDIESSTIRNSLLCSTPELQKHYEQLVRAKGQIWSPKLETISEYKIRVSPCRFIGFEWKQKEERFD